MTDPGDPPEETTSNDPPAEGAVVGPVLSRRQASSLLWGLVGGLAFLVLVQAYELVTGAGVAVAVKLGVALAVAVAAAVVTHLTRRRVSVENERA